MSKTHLRYPGSIQFERDQAELFFGRDGDIEGLYRHINVNRLTVLHGKSGLGKSSLLNAGIEPRVEKEGFHTVKIRLTSYDSNQEEAPKTSPLLLFKQKIREQTGSDIFLSEVENDESKLTVWQLFKQLEWTQKQAGRKGVLLVFDQFEEIFTWPTGLDDFGREFSDLVLNRMPETFQKNYFRLLNESPESLEPKTDQIDFTEHGLNLRIVLSIRSDRMSMLDRLSPWLPKILQNNYELRPLDAAQAEQAIVSPAAKTGDFASPAFSYDGEAVQRMLDYLSENEQKPIESFQLQVLCSHLEERVKSGEIAGVTPENLGDIEDVYKNFYGTTLNKFAEGDRLAVQKFIEEGLIFATKEESRRIPMYGGMAVLQWKISPESLGKLVDLHLVRAEPHSSGGFLYELCHDSMLAPIVEVRELRTAEERREAEEKARLEEAEKLAAERREAEKERARLQHEAAQARRQAEKDRRQKRQAFGLALAAILALLVAVYQSIKARESEQKAIMALNDATRQRAIAEVNADSARRQTDYANDQKMIAEKATRQANENFRLAELNEKAARDALAQLEASQFLTQKARKQAEDNLAEAKRERKIAEDAKKGADVLLADIREKNRSIVNSLVAEAEGFIRQIKYNEAAQKLKTALPIGEKNPELVRLLKEIVFFENEAGRADEAVQFLLYAWKTHQPGSQPPTIVASSPTVFQEVRQALKSMDEGQFIALQNRYFPFLKPVPGGKFMMGSLRNPDEQPVHEVVVSSFEMAETEATVWQFALFCAAKGLDLQAFDSSRDFEGNEPMASVSWFDAAQYANWLNERAGLQPVYEFSADGKTLLKINADRPGWRLPAEAEWEFAAKNGDEATFSGGENLNDLGWFLANSNDRLHAVKKKSANGFGLHDLNGNVREWCQDWFKSDLSATVGTDPMGPATGTGRVLRGGAFRDLKNFCTTTARQAGAPGSRSGDAGFRLIKR